MAAKLWLASDRTIKLSLVLAASSGMTALLKLISFKSCIVAILATHMSKSSFGTSSSQSNFLVHRSCRSNFKLAVRGVAKPKGSNTLATRPVSVRLVKHLLRAWPKSPATGSGICPRLALPSLGGPMSSRMTSSSGRQRYPASPTCTPSADTAASGAWPENVNAFTAILPLARIVSIPVATE